jgi:pimeloyl-ACP methyl ester carboxylesterase
VYRVKIGERDAVIILPRAEKLEPPLPWVVYHTGAGEPGDVIANEGPVEKPPIIKRLLTDGFLVASITSGTQHWGDPSAEVAHEQLYQYIRATFPVRPRVNLFAQSMGGTSAYPWASQHPERVERIYGIYPITNRPAMGARNPIQNLAPLAKARVPVLHRHGTEDKSVPFEPNAKQFEQTYRELGGPIRVIPVPGLGHQYDAKLFVADEIAAFFAGRIAVDD